MILRGGVTEVFNESFLIGLVGLFGSFESFVSFVSFDFFVFFEDLKALRKEGDIVAVKNIKDERKRKRKVGNVAKATPFIYTLHLVCKVCQSI